MLTASAIALGLKAIELAPLVAQGVTSAVTAISTIKTLLTEQREPTAAEWASLDVAEQASYEAVQAS